MWASKEIRPSEMAICRACVTPPSAGKVGRVAEAIAGATTPAVATGVAKTGAIGAGATMVTGEEAAEVDEKGETGSTSKILVVLGGGTVGRGDGSAGDGATEYGFKRGADLLRRGAIGVGAEMAVVEVV